MRRHLTEPLIVLLIYLVSLDACANAQQPQPYYPPPQYQIYWQPVAVPGYYVATPRVLPVLDFVFGPRVYFQPLPPQPVQQPQR
jgi:hypothetical protein